MKNLILVNTIKGKSVIANKNFKKGDFIIEFKGKKYKKEDNPKGFNNKVNHYLQIGENLYLGPTKTIDNYINHSCNPNSGLKISDKVLLFAIKDIKKGEEITFDYSTTMDEDNWEMDCICGYKNCRLRIRDFKYLPNYIKEKYRRLNIVPEYILKKIKNIIDK